MAISERQAAAIQRRKRQLRMDLAQAEERKRLALVMPAGEVEPPTDPDVVGWAIFGKLAGGEDHQCITCHPTKPGLQFGPVQRFRLAALRRCGTCGTVLETVNKEK